MTDSKPITVASASHRLAFIPNPASRIVSFRIVLPKGSAHETEGRTGVGSLCAETLFRGSRGKNLDALITAVDSIAFRHAAGIQPEYLLVGGEVRVEHFTAAAELTAEIISEAAFPEEDVEAEKLNQLQAIAERDELPGPRLADTIGRVFWGPLGRDADGNAEDVQRLLRGDALDFLDVARRTNGRIAVVSGGIAEDEALKTMERALGRLPRPELPEPGPIVVPPDTVPPT